MKYKILYHMLKKVKASLSGGNPEQQAKDDQLMKECKKKHPILANVKILFSSDPKANPNIVDDDGNTPALLAAKQGDFQILEILIENGANIEERDREGNTCIMLAASRMDSKMFGFLLEKGAKCDDTIMNVANQTTLDLAELKKTTSNMEPNGYHVSLILPYLKTLSLTNQLEKTPSEIDLEQIKKLFSSEPFPREIVINGDPNDMTATMLASINGHLAALEYLVGKGFSCHDQNTDNMTCTLYAAMYGHVDILTYLVEKQEAKIDKTIRDSYNNTCTLFGVLANLDTLKFLIEHGAEWDNTIMNDQQETCMILAVKSGDVERVKYLQSIGAVYDQTYVSFAPLEAKPMIDYFSTPAMA